MRDPEFEHDEIETRVLRVGKDETNGLPDLEISETLTTMKETLPAQAKPNAGSLEWRGLRDVSGQAGSVMHCGACGPSLRSRRGLLWSALCCATVGSTLRGLNHSCRSVGGGSVPFCADPAKGRCEPACTANALISTDAMTTAASILPRMRNILPRRRPWIEGHADVAMQTAETS